LLLLIFPAFLLVVLRGNVGTDTFNYLNFFREHRLLGYSNTKFEPGFEFLGLFFAECGIHERASIALIATLITIVLCKLFSRSKEDMLLFSLIVFPIFYFDFTMNGIRYGLAFTISAVAIDSLYKNKYKKTYILSILAILFHYSSFLVILPFFMNYLKRRYWVLILSLIGGFILLFPNLFNLVTEYLNEKEFAYSTFFSPSILSGVAPLFLTFSLYLNFIINAKRYGRESIVHLIFIAEIVSFIIARYSYAGLRLQGAFLFAMIIFLKYNWKYIKNTKRYAVALLVISFMSFSVTVKNISSSTRGNSPFLPYEFFWEAKY
jgi:hypothetical protein